MPGWSEKEAGLSAGAVSPMKLSPKVILEGTRLTRKTEIAFALNEDARIVGPRKYRYHSPVVSGEWCGFTNVPWGRGLVNFAPEEEQQAMETYATWMRLFELLRYYSWMVDRFHISTQVYQQMNRGVTYDFGWLEERLAAINFRLIFCTRSEASFAAAREERLKVSGNPAQYDDLGFFVREQERMREFVERSRLQRLEVDMSDDDVPRAVSAIAEWLAATGGLSLP